jgi:hypothetical protein
MMQLSQEEGMPGDLVQEAKRAGIILFASDVAGNKELVENTMVF